MIIATTTMTTTGFDYDEAGIAKGDAAELERTATAIGEQQDISRKCWWQMARLVAVLSDRRVERPDETSDTNSKAGNDRRKANFDGEKQG